MRLDIRLPGWAGGAVQRLWAGSVLLAAVIALQPPSLAAPAIRIFDLPACEAAVALKEFARQSDREIVFSPDTVAGVTTRAVRGRHTIPAALERLLAGTGLAVLQDGSSAAIAIYRRPPAPGHAPGSAAPTRVIRGRVRNKETGMFLEGARVEVQRHHRTVLSERDGTFVFDGLSAEPVELYVSYTGLDPAVVRVRPGEDLVKIVLGSERIRLQHFVVSELREGNARALTQQRNAMNVMETVATDAFGNLRDGNIGELLVLLPGVVGEWVGNDIRTVQIRGFHANLGTVTLDGSKLANAESGGNERNFEWDAISADHIESVEVIKAPTPDMEADSIGGTVNLKTKSAFDFSDRRRTILSLGLTLEHERHSVLPNGSISHSQVFGARRALGLSFNWGYSRHNVPRDGTQLLYPARADIPNYIQQVRLYDQENIRERTGGGLKLDYKVNEHTSFFVNALYSYFNESIGSRSMSRRILLATDGTTVAPGYSDDRVEWLAGGGTTAVQEILNFPKEEQTGQLGAGGRHRAGAWTLDYDASVSTAATSYDSAKYKRGGISPILRGIGVILDRRATGRHFPVLTQTAGPDLWDLDHYAAAPLLQRDRRGEDGMRSGQLNVERRLDLPALVSIKAGVKYRTQERVTYLRDRRYDYLGPDGQPVSGDEGLARFAEDHAYPLVHGRYPAPRWVSVRAVAEALAANPDWFQEDAAFGEQNRLAHDRSLRETVSAGYALAKVALPRLSLLGGVRYERTEVEGEAGLRTVTAVESARRRGWEGALTVEESLRRVQAEYSGRIQDRSKYAHVFPGLHLRYEPARDLVLRASYSTAIGRPNFGTILPDTVVNSELGVVQTNETGLLPQYGRSLNLGVHYYVEPVGLVGVGWFHTAITDFVFTSRTPIAAGPDNGFNGDYAGFELRTQSNGGTATVEGIEFNYLQQLSFLSGPLRNFGVFGNYTRLWTRGQFGGAHDAPATQLAGFVPESANAGISYTGGRISARLKATYKGEWLTDFAPDPAARRYTESRTNIDFNLLYHVTSRLSVFVDWMNIFDAFDPDYQFRASLVRTYIPSGSRLSTGVRIEL